jgi:hypothetical protein
LRRTLRLQERAELQQLWTDGLNSGPGQLGSMDAIKREARRRFDAKTPKPD